MALNFSQLNLQAPALEYKIEDDTELGKIWQKIKRQLRHSGRASRDFLIASPNEMT